MDEEYTWHANPIWLLVPYIKNLSESLELEVDWDAVQSAVEYCDSSEV